MRPYLIQQKGMPVGALMKFPRLSAINTQADEITNAANSKLCHWNVVDKRLWGIFISRRDGCRPKQIFKTFDFSFDIKSTICLIFC